MPDPAAPVARLAEIRVNHACADEVWQAWVEQGRVQPAPLTCYICTVFRAYDALVEAVLAFGAKYDELRPAMDGAFAFQANHGLPYSGPTWEVERNAMIALARAGRGGGK